MPRIIIPIAGQGAANPYYSPYLRNNIMLFYFLGDLKSAIPDIQRDPDI
jgi:hypothetical protein